MFYSVEVVEVIQKQKKKNSDDGDDDKSIGSDARSRSIDVNDLKNRYRSVLKYVKTLPSSHNWMKYIKEKVS